jgi:hypothetical protein
MKAQIKVIGKILLLFTATLLLIPSTCEAQVKQMSAQELTQESTSILYGKCTQMKSAWTEDGEMILTTVTVVPEHYLKGNLGSEVTITIPGGQVDDIVYEVSEMPAFRKGEEVFAFIWKHPSGMNLVTGGYQGKLRIGVDTNTGRRIVAGRQLGETAPAQSVLEPAPTSQTKTKALQETTPSKAKFDRMSLDDFTKEVEGYLTER